MVSQNKMVQELDDLKSRRNAILLVHNYQVPELQDVADFRGDSLGLSRKAAESDADVIVFCGVHFMAETASILCREKTVLIPDLHCGCPMADMIDAEQLRALKREHPGAVVVCYVNSSAEVKAESDLCCTSANSQEIVNSVGKDRSIIFVPDRFLGTYTASQTGRDLILWDGYCPVHANMSPEDIARARREHPGAAIVVHPECGPEVTEKADAVESTSGMCRFSGKTKANEIVVGTEVGMIYRLQTDYPDKSFYPLLKSAECAGMKRNSFQKVVFALREMQHKVKVPEDIAERAEDAINAMVQAG
ncbi:MAG: quinolinate synthase NadA [Candidatus Brocadiia bacterium]